MPLRVIREPADAPVAESPKAAVLPDFDLSDFEGFSGLNDNIRQLDGVSQVLAVFTGISFTGYPRTTVDCIARSTVRGMQGAKCVRQMVHDVEPEGEFYAAFG